MSNTTITNFRANLFEYIKSVVQFNDVLDVSTKDGNAVVLSKADYEAMLETMRVLSTPGMAEKLAEAEIVKDLTPLSEVKW